MTLRDLTLEGLEQSLNRILALDPDARQRLAGLHGRVIRINFRGIGIRLNFVPGNDGRLQIGLGRTGERLGRSVSDNLSEYLTEESRLLPHHFEVEDFLDDVDQLRDAVDRLEARIALLALRKAGMKA